MKDLANNSDVLIPMAAGTILLVTLIVFIGYFLFLHYKTRQRFDWERQQFKQAVLQTEIEIREETLTQISRDLHDNLGQIASLIKINLNLVSKDLKEVDQLKIEDSIDLLKRMIADIKSLSTSLNSENLKNFGLLEALNDDIQRINKTGHLNILIHSNGTMPALAPEIEIFIYRMSQEIINNALKHAGAKNLIIDLTEDNNNLHLLFQDDGKGFNTKEVIETNSGKGNGLSNLYKRCKIIGADLSIKSTLGGGTQISIHLPLKRT
jgi:two-component system NarL family sensor kinase